MASARSYNLPALPTHDGGLSFYISEVQKFPMLTADQEFMLGKRFQETGDRGAVQQLVTSHLRLVVKVAFGYRGYGLPLGDLIAEGNIGLMQAVKKFDPDRGFRLSTYALWWIKASIQEFVLKSWSLVKIGTTAAQKKLFFGLRKAKAAMHAMETDLTPAQVHEIADRLNVTEREVVEMNGRMAGGDASLNTPMTLDGEGEWIETLVDHGSSVEQNMAQDGEYDSRMDMLTSAMGRLNPREREIFTARRLAEDPKTLEELAARHGVSRERVRQIEAKAYEKVQKWMTAA